MRDRKKIAEKLEEVERQVRDYRDKKNLSDEHWELTEQMAVLRWVLNSDWEWDEDGIRDT